MNRMENLENKKTEKNFDDLTTGNTPHEHLESLKNIITVTGGIDGISPTELITNIDLVIKGDGKIDIIPEKYGLREKVQKIINNIYLYDNEILQKKPSK